MNYVYGGGETFIKTTSTSVPPSCLFNQGGDLWSPNKECFSDCIIGSVKLEFPDFCCCYFIEDQN